LTTRIECSREISRESNGRLPPLEPSPARRISAAKRELTETNTAQGVTYFLVLEPWKNTAEQPFPNGNRSQRHSLTRCQLPQPNCQRTTQADATKAASPPEPPERKTYQRLRGGNDIALIEPARDFCHGQRHDSESTEPSLNPR